MRKKRILLFIALSPFILLFLLLALISGSNYSEPPAAEIQALIPQKAATQSQAAAWLQSENRLCTLSPVPETGIWSMKAVVADSSDIFWANGASPSDAHAASSMIFTDFGVRPRSLGNSWARNVLQCHLYFDREGRLMVMRTQHVCFGF